MEMKTLLTIDNLNKFKKRKDKKKLLIKIFRYFLSLPYKYLLAFILQIGLKINYFDYPPVKWPPPNPSRKFIEDFLKNAGIGVTGPFLEFDPPYYKDLILNICDKSSTNTKYDVISIIPGPSVTIVSDIQNVVEIPDNSYDCIICTHVLGNIAEPIKAVKELHRILKPCGVLLLTVPGISPTYSPHPIDCWRFTKDSVAYLLKEFSRVEIFVYGNAALQAATPYFLMTSHFIGFKRMANDEKYPIIVAAKAWK